MSHITIDIRKGDLLKVKAAAIVNPANSTGAMADALSLDISAPGCQHGAIGPKEPMLISVLYSEERLR